MFYIYKRMFLKDTVLILKIQPRSREEKKKKQRKETMKWQFLNIKQDFPMQAHRKPNTP